MPLFCLHALDNDTNGPALRAANRPDHLKWSAVHIDKIRMAGPLMSDDGEQMIGSVFIFEMDTLADVKALIATDPYQKAGLSKSVDLRPLKWLLGEGKPQ